MKIITNHIKLILIFISIINISSFKAQSLPECEAQVPFFELDLSSIPDSAFTTPEVVRQGNCCGTSTSDNYLSFYVTLNPNVAMFEIIVAPGYADPSGAGVYNIISGGDLNNPGACGTDIAGGQPICIVGSGPHKITYRKPGKNKVKYIFRQIPKPIFPNDDSTRVGCSLPLEIFGLDNITITSINSSTGNTTPGAYNSLLSCTNCSTPSFSPGLSTPQWIDYQICGTPQAQACGSYTPCDTVRLYTFNELAISATPNPASFCLGGSGVTLTATATGGDGNYNFQWKNSLGTVVSSNSTYLATTAGTYTAEVIDGLTSSTCPTEYVSVPVTIGNPPIVNAGMDQTLCASDPEAFLTGSVQYATGGSWSGGNGTYTPSEDSLLTSYMPTASEISNGSVTLTLTSYGAGGGCINDSSQVIISFSDSIFVNPSATPISCNGNTTTILSNATGGTPPLSYNWSTGSTSSSISASAGTYSVMVRDIYGCASGSSFSISNPTALSLALSSNNVSIDTLCDGNATVSISGGSAPYNIMWDNGDTTLSTSSTLCYGITSVTVTDANGCSINGSVVINKPSCSAFNVTATSTDVDCYGGNNGTASSFPTGGTLPYSYVWNSTPNQLTQNASNLPAGNYTITVTDSNGCIDVAGVYIDQPTVITNTITHTDVTSIGGSDGSATANPQGGTPNYQYLWTPGGQNTQTATNLTSAVGGQTYYLTITDDNSCTLNDSVLINQPPCNNFILAVNSTNVSCNGNNDGSAYVVIAHGTAPYNIVWSHGPVNTTNVTGLTPGNYTVTVTDASNCTTFQTFTITEPDALSLGLVPTNITCFGSHDGTIDLTVSGGTFPYYYNWETGSTTIANHEDLVNLGPGTYSIEIYDNNKCSATGSIGITQPSQLNTTYNYTDILCYGYSDGTIDMSPTGGVSPYLYSWNGPSGFSSSSQDISGLSPGLYEFEFSDGSNCQSSTYQVYINQPDTVSIEDISISCPNPGSNTVNVNVNSILGGNGGPYQISFDNQVTYQPLGVYTYSLNVGATYQVWAKDANGCTSLSPYSLTIDTNVNIASVSFNPCIPLGSTTIPVTINPTGGNGGPYQVSTDGGVSWNTTGTYIINLNVNSNYNISVKDTNGCISTEYPIQIPAELNSNIIMSSEVSCLGNNDGVLDLTVSGGTPNYQYAWSGPSGFNSINEDLNNLYAGFYYVTITDDLGCTKQDSINITTVTDTTSPVISCVGDQTVNTSITSCTYTVSGIAWDANATDNCIVSNLSYVLTGATIGTGSSLNNIDFNLGVTTVTWTATDSVGNSATCSYNITVIDNIDPAFIACGAGDQSVNVDANQCSYTVSGTAWDATASDNCTVSSITADLTGVTTASGLTTLDEVSFNTGITTVTWTVTDTVGNSATCSYTIEIIDTEFPIISNCPTDITIDNDSNQCGAVVNWSLPTFTDNCGASMTSNYNSGDYFDVGTTTVTYTVTDSAGNTSICTFDIFVNDTELPVISCSAPITSCDSLVNFNIPTATDNCGVLSTTQISGLPSGSIFPVGTTTNTFEVIDIHNNISQCSFDVTIYPTPVVSIQTTDVSCNGFNNGSIDITVTNGTTPYTYSWSNSETTEDIFNLAPGTYSVLITDTNTCSVSAQADIYEPNALSISGIDTHVKCFNENNGSIDISVEGGTLPYNYNWNNSEITEDIFNLTADNYNVSVTDSNGCIITYSTTITQPDSLMIQTLIYDATCNADNGSIQVQVTGGTTPYLYNWSDGSSNLNLNNVVAGTYTLTVTDINLCSNQFTGTINSVSNLIGQTSSTDVSCYGGSDGKVNIFISSGNAPYSYLWSTGDTTTTVTNLTIGNYNVVVTDVFGCEISESLTIGQPDSLIVELDAYEYISGTNISLYGGNDGFITSMVFGGISPYEYLWSNGASTPDINDLKAGEYSLIVKDNNGCNGFSKIILTQPNILEMPSGYSPNGDGSNDFFVIKGVEAYPNNEITVFNRWGNIVYEKRNYQNEWDGNNLNGNPLPDATYFVIFTAFTDEDITLKGYVDLRR